MTMSTPEYITINGTRYASEKLSDAAKIQIANIQVVDTEIARLNQQLAIAQTARNAYSNALIAEIKAGLREAPATEPTRKTRAPAKKKTATKPAE